MYIRKFGEACLKCQKFKFRTRTYDTSSGLIITERPGQIILSDIVGPFKSEGYIGLEYDKFLILTITDVFSRKTKLSIINKIDSQTTIKEFTKYLQNNTKPERLITDNGKNYISGSFKEFLELREIRHTLTFRFNP